MLLQGYEQQIQNGKILREAYGYRENDYSHDERMRLFDLTSVNSFSENYRKGKLPWDKNHLYFRADDDQRTVMSGQVLLRGLFDREAMEKFMDDGTYPNVVLHIADRVRDVLGANSLTCPRLRELEDAGHKSQEYQAFNNSDKRNSLRWYARDKLGASGGVEFLDCLMTTICTDRELPDPVNDFGSTGADGSMFEALAEADIMSYNLVIKHNNSEHSKLAMGPVSVLCCLFHSRTKLLIQLLVSSCGQKSWTTSILSFRSPVRLVIPLRQSLRFSADMILPLVLF